MGLIITPFLVLLLWDEGENLIEIFQSKKEVINFTAGQEALYVEDDSRPKFNIHDLINKQKVDEFCPRVYPYSVVDGGVHSVRELLSAMWRDPVVDKHYSKFKLDRARVIEAEADRDFHVSYRIGREIFWTKKKLKVAKGERLITDGINLTRTRCSNMLSEVPQEGTSPNEPPLEVLNPPLNPLPYPVIPVALVNLPVSQNRSEIVSPPSNPGPSIPQSPPYTNFFQPGTDQPVLPPEAMPFIPPVVIGGEPGVTTSPPSQPTPLMPPVVIGERPPIVITNSAPAPASVPGSGNSPVPVPEPTVLLLLGSGLIALAALSKKFRG